MQGLRATGGVHPVQVANEAWSSGAAGMNNCRHPAELCTSLTPWQRNSAELIFECILALIDCQRDKLHSSLTVTL
ncbi:hypothetical protein ATANTOWER_000187 [Ataeniobius toweri]|uniref:Uncharacterized protein n=1 Tax=Ataeniobius toweri TaxID=208326 RepID=A0ABU7AVK8_9TELE|nr:hypothetical protein [Ataeniobius toweri]